MILRVKDKDGNVVEIPALRGPKGSSLVSVVRTGGDGTPGSTDTYTITMSDGATAEFYIYNGKDGDGAGDMTASVYDPQGKKTDIFEYIEKLVAAVDATSVVFADGESWQTKYENGEFVGPAGEDGQDGQAGEAGADGVGIASITQTAASDEDGGENVITVTLTDGKEYVFSTKNGSRGSEGAAATINGVNALNLEAEEPLALEQEGDTAKLKLIGELGTKMKTASVTFAASGWSAHDVLGYQQSVAVDGITTEAVAVWRDVELSTTDADSNDAVLAAYAVIIAAPYTVEDNSVTFYSKSVPEVDVPVSLWWM